MKGKMDLIHRFLRPVKDSYFLFGPRGTGKSTWIKQVYPEALLIDLLDPGVFREYSSRPERLINVVKGSRSSKTVLIDEIQKIPELLSAVHLLKEEIPDLQFVLTGSSARKLKRSGVDLMAGRAVVKRMHPFIASELGKNFDLSDSLKTGLLPIVVNSENPEEKLNAYISLYIREEVQMEGLVRSVGNFSRFLETISFSHASVLNVSNIAREAQVGRKSAEAYIEIMEDLLLAFRLRVFTRRARRRLTAHDKFYFIDSGVFRSLRPSGPFDRAQEIDGQALEGVVAQHIRAWIDYRNMKNELYYWRTRSGVEVDFVVYGDDGLWGIEVKNTDRIRKSDLKGLYSFIDEYPQAKTLYIYRGKERQLIDGIHCIPCEEFLLRLNPEFAIENVM